MDNQALQKIRDIFASSQQITLIVGKNPPVDHMAAALSLYLSFTSKGKKVTVIAPTEPIVELSSLVGIDKVRMSAEGSGGDLVVSFPYREGEIEKVSYTIEGESLNIVVKAGEAGLTFTEQDVVFKRGSDKPELIITVGVAQSSAISEIFQADSIKDVPVVNIDNSSQNEGYGTMVLVSPKFSSLSEQVADLLLNLEYEIDIDTAQNLMLGLIAGTNNFQKPSTSYLAFEIAGLLLKRGAVRAQNAQPQNVSVPTRGISSARGISPVQSMPVRQSSQQNVQSSQTQQQRPQQQPQQREDRQDRRDAIRDALRAQSQVRNEQRPFQPKTDRPQQQPQFQQEPQIQQNQPLSAQPVGQQLSDQKPPSDWLTPKVYKGSSSV